ncbi:MAG: DUF2993 domain-containing protein [Nitriliruptorales bacterium]|nr:DUF2993 domain-containing protein [Nitriliruptorales bacterium]
MGRLFSFLVLLGVLAFLADLAVTMAAERHAGEEVSTALGAPATADLNGWPVSLRLLTGTVPEAVISGTGVPFAEGQGRLTQLEIVLTDVEVPPTLPVTTIQAASGRFEARIDQNDLRALVPEHPAVEDVQLAGDGVRVLGPGGLSVEAAVAARDGSVVLSADTGLPGVGSVELAVPAGQLPAGASLDDARVEGAYLILGGPVDIARLVEEADLPAVP